MKAYICDATEISPYLCFDPHNNRFEVSGISRPEDVRAFYYPALEWLNIFCEKVSSSSKPLYSADHPLTFSVKLEYFNSSSAKFLFDIFMSLGELKKKGVPIQISWYFDSEDEDMRDAGEEISELAEMEFSFISL